MSQWNPEHWLKYSKEQNEELRSHLQRHSKNNATYQQWIQELNTVIPDQQSNQRQQSDPNQIA